MIMKYVWLVGVAIFSCVLVGIFSLIAKKWCRSNKTKKNEFAIDWRMLEDISSRKSNKAMSDSYQEKITELSNRDGASDFAHLDNNSQQSAVDLSDIVINLQPDTVGAKDFDSENPFAPPGPKARITPENGTTGEILDASGHLSKINEADSEIIDDCQSEAV